MFWSGKPLTSELLRAEIDSAILRAGGLPANTIVAGGDQACDPHERGRGPLFANSLIILDIFPRDAASGYFGDMTRTVVRGRASDEQRDLWETVRDGQEMALKKMKPGVDGLTLHNAIKKLFADRGYPTEVRKGRQVGFFHGTGHGLGLEIHEYPRFQKTVFKKGQVLTVEPGLYYPGLGGVRLEDVAVLTDKASVCCLVSRSVWKSERSPDSRSLSRVKLCTTLGFGNHWLLLIGLPLIIGLWAQFRVKSAFRRWGAVRATSNITGAEAAREILQAAQIHDVNVVETNDFLGDHYDPSKKTLCLSTNVYNTPSVAALGIAAHESGHAIQHAKAYAPLKARMAIVPVTQIASQMLPFVIFGGLFFHITGLITLGI